MTEGTFPSRRPLYVLRVDDVWLADVGFGALSLYPLRVDETRGQNDPPG